MSFTVAVFDSPVPGGLNVGELIGKVAQDRAVLVLEDRHAEVPDGFTPVEGIRDILASHERFMALKGGPDRFSAAVDAARELYSECIVFSGHPVLSNNLDREREVIGKLDFDEALEIMSCGYEIINYPVIEQAKKKGVLLRVVPVYAPEKQTVIKEVMGMEGSIIKGVICEPDMCVFTLLDIPDVKGISYRIFKAISDEKIVVDIISLPAAVSGKQDISFSVRREDKFMTLKTLNDHKEELLFSDVLVDDNIAKVTIVGAALQSASGVAAEMFRVLYENDINVRMINTSDIKIAVIIDKSARNTAVHALHKAFIG